MRTPPIPTRRAQPPRAATPVTQPTSSSRSAPAPTARAPEPPAAPDPLELEIRDAKIAYTAYVAALRRHGAPASFIDRRGTWEQLDARDRAEFCAMVCAARAILR